MVRSTAYSTTVWHLEKDYDKLVQACRIQGISHIGILSSVTGKLYGTPDQLAYYVKRLSQDGITAWAEVFGVGHPAMGDYYNPGGTPPSPTRFWQGELILNKPQPQSDLLPSNWQYAVNEFGNPVYSTSCPNQACIDGNRWVMEQLAPIFDEIWYDDEFRLDGDQGAGAPQHSTAACYCDACLAELSQRLGFKVTREDVLSDQALHDAWIEHKTDQLAILWQAVCAAGRAVKPQLRMGLMIRWGGEERDGIDLAKLLPSFGERPLLRAGEGHFTRNEYTHPESQAIEYLETSYHVSWYPQHVPVWSETTYFSGVTQQDILKKVALSLGAGISEIAYCPCVRDWVAEQSFLADDKLEIERWASCLSDAAHQYQPIAILRTASAGRGDRQPTKRVRDRQINPLFSMAGLYAAAVRQGGWRDTGEQFILAVTGRSVWDFSLADLGERELVLDGAALLEDAPLLRELGISGARPGSGGLVICQAEGFQPDGMLLTKGAVTVIPYVWQDVPTAEMPKLLVDIRRVLEPKSSSVVVEGDPYVLPVHYTRDNYDVILLVNLLHEPRTISLALKSERKELLDAAGKAVSAHMTMAADEIKLLIAR
ncbi:MAG: hypothetical protein LLG44_03700 [Chloroflexi bacterium]|nr:hypothetical protein [Chloroflexota bacterium]